MEPLASIKPSTPRLICFVRCEGNRLHMSPRVRRVGLPFSRAGLHSDLAVRLSPPLASSHQLSVCSCSGASTPTAAWTGLVRCASRGAKPRSPASLTWPSGCGALQTRRSGAWRSCCLLTWWPASTWTRLHLRQPVSRALLEYEGKYGE